MSSHKTTPRRMTSIALPGLVDPHDLSADRQFSMNLARGMEVLRAFTAETPVLGNRDLSDRTGLPKPTISRLTYTLTLLGYLTHDSVLQKYRLGPGVLSLGHPLLASMQVRQLAKPMMEALARKTRCAVNLGMRDRASVVYIDSVRADRANTHLPDIGTSRPLLASAMGRALVMACPADERAAIVNYLKVHDRKQFAAHHAAFEENRKLFAREGYCLSLGEWREEIHAVAVPVARRRGEAGLAINCSLYSHRAAGDKLVRVVVPLLKDAVRELETALGIR